MSQPSRTPNSLSITKLDPRVRNIPIPLMFSDNDTHAPVRETLLPYFALNFFPVTTGGGGSLECGLYALAISYNAARNEFRNTTTTPAYLSIEIAQCKTWFKSKKYTDACKALVKSEPKFYGWSEESEGEMLAELLARRNLGELAMSVVLDLANEAMGTNFQLGVVHAGWRGRLGRQDPWKRVKNGPRRAPLTGWFDNRYLARAAARMVRKMVNGPVLWVFNDSRNEKSLEQEEVESTSHWEGFARDPDAERGKFKERMVYNYEIGHTLETDIDDGVWYLMQDSSPREDIPGILNAHTGAFLRQARDQNDLIPAKGYRMMRNCMNEVGLVRIAHMTKVGHGDRMPTTGTDPTDAQKFLPPGPKLPTSFKPGVGPHTKGGIRNPTLGNKKLAAVPCDGDLFEYKPFKIFRIVQATDKAGTPIEDGVDPEGKHDFAVGDFVFDTGLRPGDCTAVVKDYYGTRKTVPLRQLQAVTRPWGLPDMLPFIRKSKYRTPVDFSDVIAVAAEHKWKDLNPRDEKVMRREVKDRLLTRWYSETCILELRRMKKYVAREPLVGTAPCQRNEIVRISLFEELDQSFTRTVYNYEGGKNEVVKFGVDDSEARKHPVLCWGIHLYSKEWKIMEAKHKSDL